MSWTPGAEVRQDDLPICHLGVDVRLAGPWRQRTSRRRRASKVSRWIDVYGESVTVSGGASVVGSHLFGGYTCLGMRFLLAVNLCKKRRAKGNNNVSWRTGSLMPIPCRRLLPAIHQESESIRHWPKLSWPRRPRDGCGLAETPACQHSWDLQKELLLTAHRNLLRDIRRRDVNFSH